MDPYELAPEPVAPDLPGDVVVRRAFEDAVDAVASDVFMQAMACVRAFGDFHLAASAGPLQERVYLRLMVDPKFRPLPWRQTHLWIVSEESDRSPSLSDEVLDLLADHSDIPSVQIHPIPTESADPAGDYADSLRSVLGWRERGHDRLDCVLLDLEPDGGLSGVIDADDLDTPPVLERDGRIGLTLRFLNASRFVGVLAAGERVRDAVADLESRGERAGTPAARLRPIAGRSRWYLDADATPE